MRRPAHVAIAEPVAAEATGLYDTLRTRGRQPPEARARQWHHRGRGEAGARRLAAGRVAHGRPAGSGLRRKADRPTRRPGDPALIPATEPPAAVRSPTATATASPSSSSSAGAQPVAADRAPPRVHRVDEAAQPLDALADRPGRHPQPVRRGRAIMRRDIQPEAARREHHGHRHGQCGRHQPRQGGRRRWSAAYVRLGRRAWAARTGAPGR
jgi:hypothetical protein